MSGYELLPGGGYGLRGADGGVIHIVEELPASRCPCCRQTVWPAETGWQGRCWRCLGLGSASELRTDGGAR